MTRPSAVVFALAAAICLHACSRGEKSDVRQVRWGMSKQEVKKAETAELVNEGNEILTYRIGGARETSTTEGTVRVTVDETGETRDAAVTIEVEKSEPEYDLVYAFKDDELGMAVIHLRDPLPAPADYVTMLREKSKEISAKVGVTASGVAEYGSSEPKKDPYSAPAEICEGKYALRHAWPTVNERTDISIELDQRKFTESPDCNLSVFYESVKHPIDPVLSDELHDLL